MIAGGKEEKTGEALLIIPAICRLKLEHSTFALEFGHWSVPIVSFNFYAFASLELISEEIEDPFGDDANDLPTQEISEKIKANLDERTKG